MKTKVCTFCGGPLQQWEVDSHPDCAERSGCVAEVDHLELNDERIERVVQRDELMDNGGK